MNTFQPSEDDLHAYLDERLSPAQRQAVETYLAANPAVAAQVAGWRRDALVLRTALANLQPLGANAQLDPQAIRRRQRAARQRGWATAAALLLAIGLGGSGGWLARSQVLQAANPPMQDALEAHRLFALDRGAAVDVKVSQPAELQHWLAAHFSAAAPLPDLAAQGLHAVGGRLLATEQGAAALLLFEDAQGQRISLYLREPGTLYANMPSGERAEGDLQARYWSRGGYNYALVSHDGDPRSAALQQALSL
ncbi:MAG TPA: anti-sigma factor [Pseudomonas sp.]|nr:anti-sigma factor [Pseudomonas sp.]